MEWEELSNIQKAGDKIQNVELGGGLNSLL
jgi:hypothetical protein